MGVRFGCMEKVLMFGYALGILRKGLCCSSLLMTPELAGLSRVWGLTWWGGGKKRRFFAVESPPPNVTSIFRGLCKLAKMRQTRQTCIFAQLFFFGSHFVHLPLQAGCLLCGTLKGLSRRKSRQGQACR